MSLIKKALLKDKLDKASIQPNWKQDDATADDYIKNRPFYDYKNFEDIYWDGDTTDKIVVEFTDSEEGYHHTFYKICDIILTANQLDGTKYTTHNDGYITQILSEDMVEYESGSVVDEGYFAHIVSIAVDNDTVNIYGDNIVFPKSGLYVKSYSNGNYIDHIIPSTTTVLIDRKYLPDNGVTYISDIYSSDILDLGKGLYFFDTLYEVYGSDGQYFLLSGFCRIDNLSDNGKYFILYDYGVKYKVDSNKAIVDMTPIYEKDIDYIITSSTEGSTKKFKIIVDDSGTISAKEVIET